MVTDWIIATFASICEAVLAPLPTITLPSWLGDTGPIATVFGYAGSLGSWIPLGLTVTVLGVLLSVWAVSFVVKIIRIVASFATVGGGSAG